MLDCVVEWAKQRTTVASVGDHARAFYLSQIKEKTFVRPVREMTLVSTDISYDASSLIEHITSNCDEALSIREYYPLGNNLMGRRIVFKSDDRVVLTLIDSSGRVIPVTCVGPDGINIAAYPYTIMVSMVLALNATMMNNHAAAKVHNHIVMELLYACEYVRNANNTNASTSTCVFREIMLPYIGQPERNVIRNVTRYVNGRMNIPGNHKWFRYEPHRASNAQRYNCRRYNGLERVDSSRIFNEEDRLINI